MNPVSRNQILERLRWRYATKRFDPSRKISEEDWSALEDALVLTPSSYGLQPWRFFVITDQELKDSLVAAAYRQRQVADCSHLLVIASRLSLAEEEVDRLIGLTARARGQEAEALEGYRRLMLGDIVRGPRSADAAGWAKLQGYIALGNFMTCAALMGIDACPMEGFDAAAFDEALGLPALGLTAAALCPAGFRDPGDKHASLPKIRYPRQELVRRYP